ncbi:MAG: prepilin-type N-terminal cleavage/methylation domain-containing protein [Verrucomicrobiota bacterium]
MEQLLRHSLPVNPSVAHRTQAHPGRAGFSLVELLITVILILILTVVMLRRGAYSDEQQKIVNCQKNLQNIYLAVGIYASEHRGAFPALKNAPTSEPPLSLLVPRSTTVTAIFICPGSDENKLPEGEPFATRRISYAYYMGRLKTDGAGVPLLSDRQINTFPKIKRQQIFSENGKEPGANHRKAGGNFLFCDGEIKMVKPRATQDLLFPETVVLLNPKP